MKYRTFENTICAAEVLSSLGADGTLNINVLVVGTGEQFIQNVPAAPHGFGPGQWFYDGEAPGDAPSGGEPEASPPNP